ncbi:MAG TPA: TetR/AcrR family transcriptional regulator [Solirubrobacteraceae bacterium]|jgi:AcrR family transcriptional regulator|nr:TetR/AcrR family transcriptional regulator [Solirubrobacteraceae bacterium]
MSKQPRTAPGRATRERILQAATELVAERGVAGTSLDDVRHRAHASKSQVYLYFADRDDLMRAVSEATCDAVMQVQSDVLAGFDSLDGIERYLDTMVSLQEQRDARGGCPIGSLAGQLAEHDEGARLALAAGFDRWEEGLRAGLQALAARGELRPDADPALLARQTLAVLQGGLLLTQVRRDPAQLRAAADGVVALVRAQLKP